MLTTKDLTRVFDTILSTPGMGETVKIDLKMTRKNVLLLSNVIERGLTFQEGDKSADLLKSVPPKDLEDLKSMAAECLQKAGLIELREKLSLLESPQ